jgi:small-conductance mechanosensitive channel
MTITGWIIAGCAIPVGFVIGSIASRVVNKVLGGPTRPKPLQDAAGPLSSLALWIFVIIGLLVALGIISPESRTQMTQDFISFIPKVITAAIIVIAATVGSSFATAAMGPALGRASTSVQRQAVAGVKAFIVGIAAIVALSQLGIDATVINIVVAAFFFAIAAGVALLVGLGGRNVAREVASSRAVRRLIDIGDQIESGGVSGKVMNMHPTMVEIKDPDGATVLVPPSQLIAGSLKVTRA